MENIFSRIRQIISYHGVSNNEFGRKIGCSSAQITQMITHEKNFGIDKLLKILSNYPQVSVEWLLLGTEPMLREQKVQNTNYTTPDMSKNAPMAGVSEKKDTNNITSSQENPQIIDKFFHQLEDKNNKINELCKQVGSLETENRHLRKQLEATKSSSGAEASVVFGRMSSKNPLPLLSETQLIIPEPKPKYKPGKRQ